MLACDCIENPATLIKINRKLIKPIYSIGNCDSSNLIRTKRFNQWSWYRHGVMNCDSWGMMMNSINLATLYSPRYVTKGGHFMSRDSWIMTRKSQLNFIVAWSDFVLFREKQIKFYLICKGRNEVKSKFVCEIVFIRCVQIAIFSVESRADWRATAFSI